MSQAKKANMLMDFITIGLGRLAVAVSLTNRGPPLGSHRP